MGKRLLFFRKSKSRHLKKMARQQRSSPLPLLGGGLSPPPPLIDGDRNDNNANSLSVGMVGKGKKKVGAVKLWMRFDKFGNSEITECDKSTIIKRAAIPSRDLRILSSVFSQSSNILAREKAMVIQLEFIRAIVTADEVLILDPLRQEVLPFVERLRQQLPHKSLTNIQGADHTDVKSNEMHVSTSGKWLPVPEAVEGLECELPFEFQVLEIALQLLCMQFDSCVADLERDAYPSLDELVKNVNTNNLERVRSLKSNLTRMLARVQKVRDEIEHLLDDNEDMANLYLTRKLIRNEQSEALLGATASNSIATAASVVAGSISDDNHVEDLEMLLEAYFMQLEGTRNKITSVREYINDTEDYVNIQLDNKRNELIQIQLILTSAMVPVSLEFAMCGALSMNIPCVWYNVNGIFGYIVGGMAAGGFLIFLLILGYARWKKLLGS
ncbi:magnesium transporter MRS2-4-like [Hevea brasiliensis]|uniref:magnesium transporter MRS2-4-like n=1 Tax=Hevea brasiliensis TaxID=3981 RepID=UPI0025D271DF|nr:magnesium transporter MRS2-4-like [Hevea brasiliensis]XP_057990858.1 magnesium transporter MRS2-4-like [Hevea brasiliensis]XP_057990859.1 magnesium transporter MRS2-4-like [Hevea brasiliensis]XP_057990860.1 magnesium transporter MRS2-4-like [Hevea brasiliensis]